MTARTAGVETPAALLPRSRGKLDRRLLRFSLGVAVALHCGALMLPLPAAPEVATPEAPHGPTLDLGEFKLPPPPLPEMPRPVVQGLARRVAVPMIEKTDLEPVAVRREPAEVTGAETPEHDWGPLTAVTPPPAVEPVDEGLPGLTPPAIIGTRTSPVYPELGRRYRAEGVVVLRAVIGVEGEVTSVEILRTPEPDLGFGAAAVRAVSTWRYTPGLYRGRPVPVFVTVYVEFDLH